MKIGLDARALGSNGGGDETYTRNLIRALAAVDQDNDYTLLLAPRLSQDVIPGTERVRRIVVGPTLLQVRIPISLPLIMARAGIDLLHAQYLAPPLRTGRVVVSVHDIAYEHYPQFFTRAAVLQLRALVPLTVRRAATVLTLSEFCKQDIVRRYGVSPERIVVAPCAADPMFRPIADQARLADVRRRYGTGDGFILCVGNLQPRKNLKTLIAAYVRLRQADATRGKLVLVGRSAWLHDDTFAAARASGYADDLLFTGYVPSEDLIALYNAADVFVYPSIFEGFGLPPLEAMACGTPVVTTNTSAIPETVGDAAVTVDPLDADAMANAIALVLRNTNLRTRLSYQGLRQAGTFSWVATARTIVNVYQNVMRGQEL